MWFSIVPSSPRLLKSRLGVVFPFERRFSLLGLKVLLFHEVQQRTEEFGSTLCTCSFFSISPLLFRSQRVIGGAGQNIGVAAQCSFLLLLFFSIYSWYLSIGSVLALARTL